MRIPKIDILLKSKPHLGRRAERTRQAMRHVGTDRSALVQDFANSSSRDTKQLRQLVLRQSCRRQDILAQNLSWMRRSSLSIVQPIIRHQLKSSVIIFKVNVEGI